MDADRLLDGLDPSQRRAVTSEAQPLAILAGAGSGKTRVLTRRIAHRCLSGTADARHVLALTFTRKAATELDGRLRTFGLRDLPAAGTFHAVAYAQLRTRWAGAGTSAPALLDRKARLLSRVLGGTSRISPMEVANEIEWAKARLIGPDGYALASAQADRRVAAPPERVAGWFADYEAEKRKRGLVDFDDLLAGCADAIERDPSFAAAQRWRFRHLFVDEYQDLNPLQDRLLRAWLGDRADLCVVGDPNQAIYAWNGADPSFLTQFTRHHPGGEVVALGDSYRSTPQILAAAAAVLDGGEGRVRPLRAHRPPGPAPVVVSFPTDVDEANGIARAVHDHHGPGRPWSAQAVLVRTNAQAVVIEEAFRRGAIPYRVRGASAFLDDPDVRDLLRGYDRLREPLATTIADLESSISARRDALAGDLDLEPADDRGEALAALAASAEGRRLAAYEQVVRLGRDLLVVDPVARTEAFGGWLRTILRDEGPERADAVSIVTFHAAKGLEWDVVHLAGVEAGYVPITHARTPDARQEERRLLYVAITRAAEVLRCSWAHERTFGAQAVARKPSPWLAALGGAAAEGAMAEAEVERPTDALTRSRAALERRPVEDDLARGAAVRTALRSWRAGLARGADVRPTVVLSDRALEAIVQHLPASADDLAALGDLGPLTRQRHGARLLAIVAEHRDAGGPRGDVASARPG